MTIAYNLSVLSPSTSGMTNSYAQYTFVSKLSFYAKSTCLVASGVLIATISLYLLLAFITAYGAYKFSSNTNQNDKFVSVKQSSIFTSTSKSLEPYNPLIIYDKH